MTQPRLILLEEKKLIGKHLFMTYADNQTPALWKSFMPWRKEISNRINDDLVSMQQYPKGFDFSAFDIHAVVEKWAAVEVSNFTSVPAEMESCIIPRGLYAVFLHQGSSADISIFTYIFGEWLPSSGYQIDDRPHFEILGPQYIHGSPESEEEIWIPIKT